MKRGPEFVANQERFRVEHFTAPKSEGAPEKNEDRLLISRNTVVIADGSTPKAGNSRIIDGQSGGQIAADIVVETAAARPDLNGRDLVDAMTDNLADFYRYNNPSALANDRETFAAAFLCVRVVGEEVVITWVGNVNARINGDEPLVQENQIDRDDAAVRSAEMRRLVGAGVDVDTAATLGRKAIEPSLNAQWQLWNNDSDPRGFGYINGRHVPDAFVNERRLPLSEVRTLEIWSDGYPEPAAEPTIESWETAFAEVQAEDPHRYLTYPATKTADDRTVAIMYFDQGNTV